MNAQSTSDGDEAVVSKDAASRTLIVKKEVGPRTEPVSDTRSTHSGTDDAKSVKLDASSPIVGHNATLTHGNALRNIRPSRKLRPLIFVSVSRNQLSSLCCRCALPSVRSASMRVR